MSIASEITSIGENLKKDYQAIANLGADLTNVDKNIENIAELLDGVYDNLPKTSYQEGTEINLGVTSKGKLDYENGVVGIGQTEQDGTPTPSTPITINSVTGNQDVVVSGKNSADITGGTNYNGTSSISNNELSLTATGTWARYEKNVSVTPNVQNTFSCKFKDNTGKIKVNFYDGATDIGGASSSTSASGTFTYTFTPTSNQVKMQMYSNFSNNVSSDSVTYYEIQIEKGSTATTYEPYITPTIHQLSLGDIELNAIGNYKDELIYDVDEDKVYKNENIGKKIYTGASSENWELDINYQRAYITDISNLVLKPSSNDEKLNGISDKLIIETFTDVYTNKKQGLASSIGGAISVHIDNVTDTFTNVSQFKTWLASNPLTLYYALAEAVKEEITGTLKDQIKALYNSHSFTGTTILEVDGDLPMIIKVRGLKGE